jgi:cyclic-di-GMP-binding protein
MAGTQSFDVTTGCDLQEVDNALNHAMKEIHQRYDFKGLRVSADFRRAENKIILHAPDDFKLKAMWDVIEQKMVRRQVPIKNLQLGKISPAAGGSVSQEVALQQGIPIDTARSIVKFLKEQKIKKLQVEIQSDQVRVSSPSRDDLQVAISVLKEKDFGVELRFGNYRSI